MRTRLVTTELAELEYYRGLLIHAGERVHDDIAGIAARWLPRSARILDYGAAAGAFSLRLADMGYQVEATDVDAEKWGVPDIPFHPSTGTAIPDALRPRRFGRSCFL